MMDTQDTVVSSSVPPEESSGEVSPRAVGRVRKYADPPPTKKRAAGNDTTLDQSSEEEEEEEGSSSESEIDFSMLSTNLTSGKNTRSSTKWAVETFVCWQKSRTARFPDNSEERPPSGLLKSSDPVLLGKWLALYADEARKKDGSFYPAKTVYHLLSGLYRYMRNLNPSCPNFLSDSPYFRPIHDAFAKERSNITEYKIHRSLSNEEQDKLLASGTLSIDTPDALLKTLYVLNAKNFGLYSAEHQSKLRLSHLKRMTNPLRYVFRYRTAGTLSSISRAMADKTVYARTTGTQQGGALCHVHVLDFYLKKIPSEAYEKDIFYLMPVKNWVLGAEHWFTVKAMGRSAIAKLVGDIRTTLPGLHPPSPAVEGVDGDATSVPQSSQGSPPVSATPNVFVVHSSDPNLSPMSLEGGGSNSQPIILSTANSAVAQNIISPQQQERMLEIARVTPNPTNQPLFFIPATCTVPPGSSTPTTPTPEVFQIPNTATVIPPLNQSLYPSTQGSAVPQPPHVSATQPSVEPVIDLTDTDTETQTPPPTNEPAPAQTTNQQPVTSPPEANPSQAAKDSQQELQQQISPLNSGLPQLVFNNCHISIFVTQQAAPSSTINEE